jgi:hypothetical protein
MTDPIVMGAICKRCDEAFRFIKRPGRGRRRLYCEPCQYLERLDNMRAHYMAVRLNRQEKAA